MQHVLFRHADLCSQHMGSVRKFSGFHAAKQIEVLIDGSTAVRTVVPGSDAVPRPARISSSGRLQT